MYRNNRIPSLASLLIPLTLLSREGIRSSNHSITRTFEILYILNRKINKKDESLERELDHIIMIFPCGGGTMHDECRHCT